MLDFLSKQRDGSTIDMYGTSNAHNVLEVDIHESSSLWRRSRALKPELGNHVQIELVPRTCAHGHDSVQRSAMPIPSIFHLVVQCALVYWQRALVHQRTRFHCSNNLEILQSFALPRPVIIQPQCKLFDDKATTTFPHGIQTGVQYGLARFDRLYILRACGSN